MADNTLSLSGKQFENLLKSANEAYKVLTELGPFYGQEHIKEPTFRVTAEPIKLPKGSKKTLENLGNDLLKLGRSLKKLPQEEKERLSLDLDFDVPQMWRIDAIVDEQGNLKVNEVEGQDGASALMIAEQLAYNLQKLEESTASVLISALKKRIGKDKMKIAFIRVDNPHNTNANRFVDFATKLSSGSVVLHHMFDEHLRGGQIKPNWNEYSAVISESSLSPEEIAAFGIEKHKVLSAGNYNAIVNKGVFALIHDEKLKKFWQENLSNETLERLKDILIPSQFVEDDTVLEEARKAGKVVKTSWAGKNTSLINRSRGVALPYGDLEHSTDERWNLIKNLLNEGVKVIAQDFVKPATLSAHLRKKGTNLESVQWFNRVCVKYVVEGDPNGQIAPSVALTATEVTLGPDIIPAGRKAAFTAGIPQ